MEQSTESEEENHERIPEEICDVEAEVSQKTPNKNTPEIQTQKTPEIFENTPLQEEPRNTRGEKYNLRLTPTQITLTLTDINKNTQTDNNFFRSSLSFSLIETVFILRNFYHKQ